MKAIEIELAGQKFYLAFTGAAKYLLKDLSGDKFLFDLILPDTLEALDYLCKAAAILIEQGELARRNMGYDKGKILAPEAIKTMLAPTDIEALKLDVANAILLGYGREIDNEEKEIDLILQELEKKTTTRD